MIGESFLTYKNFRWLWANLTALVIFCAVYWWDRPIGGRNGGTILGYTYGGLATAAILYLMWFGIRKRSHYSTFTTLKGCLAGHIWLGLMLAVLVPLHCGFQFGWNVHTLAYALMLAVITSGVVGVVIYVRYPTRVQSHRGGGTIKVLLDQINALTQEIEFLAKDRSDAFLRLLDVADFHYKPSVRRAVLGKPVHTAEPRAIAALLSKLPREESDEGHQLVTLSSKKRALAEQIDREVQLAAYFRSWLYLHLPLSFALLTALTIHIFSVFFYW